MSTHGKQGFTLIEFMVIGSVLAIIGAIALHLVQLQRVQPTRHNLEEVRKAVEKYKAQFGAYPDSLNQLVEKKVLTEVPTDQWKQPLVYRLSVGVPLITSTGPDGMEDSRDDVENR